MKLWGITLFCAAWTALAADPLETWAPRYVGPGFLRDVAYGAGLFVAASDVPFTSADGVCWTPRTFDLSPSNSVGLSGVAYGNGRFVAVAPSFTSAPGSAYISADGLSWRRSADLPGSSRMLVIDHVTFCGGLFFVVGQEPDPEPAYTAHWFVMTSPDGFTWSRSGGATNRGDYYLNAATFGNGTYVVAGSSRLPQGGTIPFVLISTNATDWTPLTSFPSYALDVVGLTFGNGTFVAVGSSIVTSSDAVNWIVRMSGFLGLRKVGFGDGSFVAAGGGPLIMTSTNAIHWTSRPITNAPSFTGVTYGNGNFMVVGTRGNGMALQSGGSPQICLQPNGFWPPSNPRFQLSLTVEPYRTYRLQSSPVLPAISWTDLSTNTSFDANQQPFNVGDPTPLGAKRFYRVVSP